MRRFRLTVSAALILMLIFCGQAQARKLLVLSYQEMFSKSDLVVVAKAESKTTDTSEEGVLPGIWEQEKGGKPVQIKSIGVETVFVVSAVLKGDAELKHFTLHHYREARFKNESDIVQLNGPLLVRFDPTDPSKHDTYLLFLVRERDGRFAPVGGQTDPGMKAIIPIPPDLR